MFVIEMSQAFRVGDTATVRINGAAATLTWRDARTLVINGTDARTILDRRLVPNRAGGALLRAFTCADADGGVGIIIGAGPQG
jgi:hypothetical protein